MSMAEDKIKMIKSLIESNAPVSYYIIGGIVLLILIMIMMGGSKMMMVMERK